MNNKADLHIHSTASDGELSPPDVVKMAADARLTAIALTDHDTIDGIPEALIAGLEAGIEVIPGIEFSTVHESNTEVHMLGYFIDINSEPIKEKLTILKQSRIQRVIDMVNLLNKSNVPVDLDRVKEIAGKGSIGRPHVARAIMEVNCASSMDSAFGKYLVEGAPAFVPRYKITPLEAMELIHETGGIASCAHVAKIRNDNIIIELINHGLKAIEVYHPDHSKQVSRLYAKLAKDRGLIPTGGSDAHSSKDGKHYGIGRMTVDMSIVEKLREARNDL